MESHDTFGQFALDFEEFKDFSVGEYLKGKVPFTKTFTSETEDERRNFEYNTPEVNGASAIVMNIPFSDEVRDYDEKIRTETFRHGLAKLPYGQRMKDLGKRVVNRFR
jgi:hypothetical protein